MANTASPSPSPTVMRDLGVPTYEEFQTLFERYLLDNDPLQLSVALIDIKNFRGYRHRYGYDSSYDLLAIVADLLRKTVRDGVVGHFAHDKFLICAPSSLMGSYVSTVRDQLMTFQSEVDFEIKAGIAELVDTQDLNELTKRCKLACEAAKQQAGIVYRLYDDHLRREVEMRAHALKTLDYAIANDDIKVYLQPHVRVQTGAVCGAEALARWQDPDYGTLMPGDFIPVLEEHRLIHKVDLYIIDRVAAALRKRIEAGTPFLPISVNLSRQDFTACDIVTEVESIIHKHRIPRELIELEVTESTLHADPGIFRESIAAFRRLGYEVWMDDFGAGYSSLNVLKDYQFDLLKIDMNFLRNLNSQASARVIVSSIIDMAKQLRIRTLAEGVETVEHMDFLRSVGCEKAQGYLFSRPEPIDKITGMFNDGTLVLEDLESAHYYDMSGRVNLLSPQPMGGSASQTKVEGSLPLAIVEASRDKVVFLQCNRAFEAFIRGLGFASTAAIEKVFSQTTGGAPQSLRDAMLTAKGTGKEQHVTHVANGHTCLLRISHVATCASRDVDSYLVSGFEQRGVASEVLESLSDVAKSGIFGLFSRVDILSEEDNLIENLHISGARYLGRLEGSTFERSMEIYAENNIYREDQERFSDFFDLAKLDNRIHAGGQGYATAFFRTRTAVSGYEWQCYTILPLNHKGKRYFLSCVRDIDESPTENLPQAKGIIPEKLLWQAILNVKSINIFWKDKDRRFIGASDNFLDYYDFDSAADFVGKTDEDMGWHIDPVPFKSDEERVRHNLETVNDEVGRCIARGTVRTIAATKTPVVDDGEVLGFVGFFRELSEAEGGGALSPLRTLEEVHNAYQRALEERGLDYMYLSATIENAADYERRYDEAFVESLVQTLIKRVAKVELSRGVVIKSGTHEIAVFEQCEGGAQADTFVRECSEALNDLVVVNGIPCRPRVSVKLEVASRDKS